LPFIKRLKGASMIFNGERLENIKDSVYKNVECCKYALQEKRQVGILGKGQYTVGTVTNVQWDDLEDRVVINTKDGKNKTFYGSEITTVRLVE
jgi:hypothetical protein|tara:strand:- start:2002 stop:2280 length:279 start_codon:yes stop_codon:yes gene_type:complete